MQHEARTRMAIGGRDTVAKLRFSAALFAHLFPAVQGGWQRISIAFNLRKEPFP
jgi:hypothetical protein